MQFTLRRARLGLIASVVLAGTGVASAAIVTPTTVALPTGELLLAQAAAPKGAAAARRGDERVMAAQRALAAMRIDPGPIDGVMGPKTRAAIRTFQTQRRIAPSGELDAATLAALGVR